MSNRRPHSLHTVRRRVTVLLRISNNHSLETRTTTGPLLFPEHAVPLRRGDDTHHSGPRGGPPSDGRTLHSRTGIRAGRTLGPQCLGAHWRQAPHPARHKHGGWRQVLRLLQSSGPPDHRRGRQRLPRCPSTARVWGRWDRPEGRVFPDEFFAGVPIVVRAVQALLRPLRAGLLQRHGGRRTHRAHRWSGGMHRGGQRLLVEPIHRGPRIFGSGRRYQDRWPVV